MLANKAAATPERVAVLQQPLARVATTRAYATWLPVLMEPDRGATSMRPSAYAGIARPVALLWGDADTVTPLPQGERLAKLIPGASLRVIPGIGHIPHIEAPEPTLAWLREQLGAIAAKREPAPANASCR
jgi:pimeloyl-ACP methyl ester carboxylesterase